MLPDGPYSKVLSGQVQVTIPTPESFILPAIWGSERNQGAQEIDTLGSLRAVRAAAEARPGIRRQVAPRVSL